MVFFGVILKWHCMSLCLVVGHQYFSDEIVKGQTSELKASMMFASSVALSAIYTETCLSYIQKDILLHVPGENTSKCHEVV